MYSPISRPGCSLYLHHAWLLKPIQVTVLIAVDVKTITMHLNFQSIRPASHVYAYVL